MARQKTVFGSNKQTAHIWAQQTQPNGRSSGGNVYFEGTKIYSYGSHYLMAEIHTVKGKKFAIRNSHSYSPTTGQHRGHVWSALYQLMPMFDAKDPSNPKAAIAEVDKVAADYLTDQFKRVKVTNKADIKFTFQRIHDLFKESNQLRKLLGRAEKWPKKKELADLQSHLDKRLARWIELEPVRKARDAARSESQRLEREARAAKYEADMIEARKADAEALEAFKRGERIDRELNLEHDLIQVRGEKIVTSRGAEVPLVESLKLYALIKEDCNKAKGKGIGHFTFDGCEAGGKILRFGCHRILLSEADRVLGGFSKEWTQS